MLRHGLLLLSLGTILAGCSENRAAKLSPRCGADFATLRELWNASDLVAFVAYVDAERFLDNREEITHNLSSLRREIGAIRQLTEPMIDGNPEDRRAYAVAHLVTTTEYGVARFSLAYGKELTIQGFNVQGNSHPAAPR